MGFILGCNYWASNAGALMWRDFDAEVIDKDLRALSQNGIKYLRVFPNWKHFQSVYPVMANRLEIVGYKTDARCENPYYLDEDMLDCFSTLLDLCDKYGMRVIVGLVTGFMSGAMFIPSALYGKDIMTDPVALYFEQLYIKGFVSRFKSRDAIMAWDLGNECNEMDPTRERCASANWTATVSNAIRACDNTRPIVSGMHYLNMREGWTIFDQAEFCDVLTTHPYPYWCEATRIDNTLSLRNTLFATAQTKYYSEVGGRPCLAEEMGTMGPMVCSDEGSADFLRVNLFSLWANGAQGAMWWCSSDQTLLDDFPYTVQMVERELGLLRNDHTPKPALSEFRKFDSFLKSLDFELPTAKVDAVCVLTRDQRHWPVAFMSYILARKTGLNVRFEHGDNELPDSPLYILPSINGVQVLPKARYEELKRKVESGSELYISFDRAILSELETLAGIKVIDSYDAKASFSAKIGDRVFDLSRFCNITFKPTSAEVLALDSEGNPFITANKYGKGRVLVVNAPIEESIVDVHNAFDSDLHLIYEMLFKKHVDLCPIKISSDKLLFTLHQADDGFIVVVTNHSGEDAELKIDLKGHRIDKLYYGDIKLVKAYDGCVFKIVK